VTFIKDKTLKGISSVFAFVSVSQSFQVEELLRSIIRQILERGEEVVEI
jgi:hypothetical protein